jgi:hypothetical protein
MVCCDIGKRGDDLVDKRCGRFSHPDGDGALLGCRLLEGGELARQQARRHEMAVARHQSRDDERLIALQIDEADIGPIADDDLPVAPFECRAGDDAVLFVAPPLVDLPGDRREPGNTVGVVERNAVLHLSDVAGAVEIVGIGERPAQTPGQHGADRGLAATGDDHDHDNGWREFR